MENIKEIREIFSCNRRSVRDVPKRCDGAKITTREMALRFLREGIRRGLVSEQKRNGFPQNVWAFTDEGVALEAQLENSVAGTYHGYPMQADDPFVEKAWERWRTIGE